MCIRDSSYISLLEKGRKSATVDTSAKLAHAFGITLAELFTFSGVPPQADPKDAQMMDILLEACLLYTSKHYVIFAVPFRM